MPPRLEGPRVGECGVQYGLQAPKSAHDAAQQKAARPEKKGLGIFAGGSDDDNNNDGGSVTSDRNAAVRAAQGAKRSQAQVCI